MPRPDTCGWGHQTRLQGWISCQIFIQNKPCWPCHWNANQKFKVCCTSFATFGKMNHVCKNVDPWGHGPANNEEKCNCAGWRRSLTVMCGFDRVRSHTTWSGYNVPAILDSGPKQQVTRVPQFLHWSSYLIHNIWRWHRVLSSCLHIDTVTLFQKCFTNSPTVMYVKIFADKSPNLGGGNLILCCFVTASLSV